VGSTVRKVLTLTSQQQRRQKGRIFCRFRFLPLIEEVVFRTWNFNCGSIRLSLESIRASLGMAKSVASPKDSMVKTSVERAISFNYKLLYTSPMKEKNGSLPSSSAVGSNVQRSNDENRTAKKNQTFVHEKIPVSTSETTVGNTAAVDTEDVIPPVPTLSRGQNLFGMRRNGRPGIIIYSPFGSGGRRQRERILQSATSPGAISVRGINHNPTGDESVASNEGPQPDVIDTPVIDQDDSEPHNIVAHLASEVDIGARVAAQLETHIEHMLERRMDEVRRTAVVADRVGSISTIGRKKYRTLCIVIMIVSVAVAGLVAGLMYRSRENGENLPTVSTESPTTSSSVAPSFGPLDPLVSELRDFIAPTEADLELFRNALTPQAQALAWLHEDPITSTPGRSSRTVLERYVVMVLYFSTSGSRWNIQFGNTSESLCSWNLKYNYAGNSVLWGLGCKDGTLTILNLSDNNLVGTIPWELGLLRNLTRIWLHENSLSGFIPSQIGHLTRLESFYAFWNSLSGALPSTFFPVVTELRLDKNSFSGTIPSSWGTTMPSMEILYLDENSLSGTIPTTFGRLTNLEVMDLYFNRLTGSIPTELGQITSLSTFHFNDNMIAGSVNETFCVQSSVFLRADCEVECPCCSSCW